MRMDSTFLAWLAGFVDGEGCFHIQLGNGGKAGAHAPSIVVANTHEGAMREIVARCGGALNVDPRRPPSRPVWQWRLAGAAAVALARDLAPLLRVKTDPANTLAAFPLMARAGTTHSRARIPADVYAERERLRLVLNNLNRRGTQGTVNSH